MNTQEFETQLRSGYLSFSRADIEKSLAEGGPNTEAYRLMLEATKTNDSYEIKKGVAANEIYPLTKGAVETMDKLLKEAEQAADNPQDKTFSSRLTELKRVAEWSGSKKKQFHFRIILGGLLWMLFYFLTPIILSGPDNSSAAATVKAWSDTPPSYTMEELLKINKWNIPRLSSASNYKQSQMRPLAEEYDEFDTHYNENANSLKYYNLTEKEKEACRHSMQVCKAKMDSLKAEYDEVNAKGMDYWRQMALDEVGERVDEEAKMKALNWGLVAYFVVIIILYVLTNLPHGYMLSRQRTIARVLGGIQKALFSIISWLGISGAQMGWTDPDKIVTIFWSDGTISKHLIVSDLINSSLLFKAMFYILALVFCMCMSAYLLPILTIIGFFINIDRKKH